jgi:predicted nucleic acid-binding protein
MIRIFLDSSVLFSAAYSPTGHSRDLLLMAARGEIVLVISPHVVMETRRNLTESAPDTIPYLELLFDTIPFEYIKPAKRDVLSAAKHVALKDAPIIAAAKKARVDFLVTDHCSLSSILPNFHSPLATPNVQTFRRANVPTNQPSTLPSFHSLTATR